MSEITTNDTFTQEKIELVKRTVAKGATDDELAMFLHNAKKYNLDPFLREIVFTKYKLKDGTEKVSIITTRDGYLKIAHSHQDFKGLISFAVCEGDTFEIDAANYQVRHVFGSKRGKIVGAWARVDREGYKPFIAYVPFNEYYQSSNTWNKYPSAMIQKVAEAFALKRAFNISGLVTREELGIDEDNINVNYSNKNMLQSNNTNSDLDLKKDLKEHKKNEIDLNKNEETKKEITNDDLKDKPNKSMAEEIEKETKEASDTNDDIIVFLPEIISKETKQKPNGEVYYKINVKSSDGNLIVYSKEDIPDNISIMKCKINKGMHVLESYE